MCEQWTEGWQDGLREGHQDCLHDLNNLFNTDIDDWDDMLEFLRKQACIAFPGKD